MNSKSHPSHEKRASFLEERHLIESRRLTWVALDTIRARIFPGMSEEEAQKIADRTLKEMGATKNWHRTHVRFGVNTARSYGEPSESGVVLGENDSYFIDMGPVWTLEDAGKKLSVEGDGGRTFLVGQSVGEASEKERCRADSERIFARVVERWKSTGESGVELYRFAEAQAREAGWELDAGTKGHRLSDFPHQVYFKGSIEDLEFRPSPHAWVLEIHLRHPSGTFGAFYEDLLF